LKEKAQLTTWRVVGDLVALACAGRGSRGSSLAEAAPIVIVVVVVVGGRGLPGARRGGQAGPAGARCREVVGGCLGRLAEVAAASLPAIWHHLSVIRQQSGSDYPTAV